MAHLAVAVVAASCASGPRPGGGGHDATGVYMGRLVVEGQYFDARLELRASSEGAVRGTFSVSAPFDVEGRATGALVDDLLRLTLTYETGDPTPCDGRIEGILTIGRGGETIDGPVTVTDCEGSLAGRASFRR